MGFFDFIGNKPDQLSLAEILSAVPAIAGPALMARGGRIGLPLGMGLTAFGGLGQELAQKRQTQAQHQGLADALGTMPGVTDQQRQFFGQMVQSGVDPQTFLPEVMKSMFPANKQATGPRELAAGALGLPMDSSKWTADQFQKVADWETKFKLSGEKLPETEASKLDLYGKERQLAQQYQKPPQPSWRTETDPTTGATVQNAYRYNAKSGKMELVPTAGEPGGVPAKLDTNERKQLDAVRLVSTQIPRMNELVQQLPPDTSPALLAREYAKFRAPFGALGTVDPRFGAYFQQIGQLKAALISSAASGFRGQYMIDMLKQHIPSETDPPARAMEKIKGFDEGGFNAVLSNYLGTGTPIAPSGGGAASGGTPPKPAFDVDKTYQKDGQWYVRDKAGKFFQFDGSKWAPL